MNLRGKIFLAAALFIGVTLGIVFFVAIPMITEIDGVRNEVATLQNDTSTLENRILRVRQYREFAKKEKDNLEMMDGLLADSQMPDFINYLESSAKETEVEMVLSPSISRSESAEDWPAMNYQADIVGNIDDILNFLGKIEACPYLVEIEGFGIRAGINEPGAKNRIVVSKWSDPGTAHISLKVYVKK